MNNSDKFIERLSEPHSYSYDRLLSWTSMKHQQQQQKLWKWDWNKQLTRFRSQVGLMDCWWKPCNCNVIVFKSSPDCVPLSHHSSSQYHSPCISPVLHNNTSSGRYVSPGCGAVVSVCVLWWVRGGQTFLSVLRQLFTFCLTPLIIQQLCDLRTNTNGYLLKNDPLIEVERWRHQ